MPGFPNSCVLVPCSLVPRFLVPLSLVPRFSCSLVPLFPRSLGPCFHGIPTILCVCKLNRHCGCCMQYLTASSVFVTRSGPSIGCTKANCRMRAQKNFLDRCRSAGKHKFQFVATLLHQLRSSLGTNAKPVDSFGSREGSIGLNRNFEAAGVEPRQSGARQAAAEALHRCRPQIAFPAPSLRATWLESRRPAPQPSRTFRRRGHSCRRQSVSQNLQIAAARSCSRPDQRLQPANRQKDRRAPGLRPSPCNV